MPKYTMPNGGSDPISPTPVSPSTAGEDRPFVSPAASSHPHRAHSDHHRSSDEHSSQQEHLTDTSPLYRSMSGSSRPPKYRSRSHSQLNGSNPSLHKQAGLSASTRDPLRPSVAVPAIPQSANHPDRCRAPLDSPCIELAEIGPAEKPQGVQGVMKGMEGPSTQGLHFLPDVKAPLSMGTAGIDRLEMRTSDSEYEEQQGFDDYDWDTDEDIVGDSRFDALNADDPLASKHHGRKTLAHRFSPYNIIKFLATSFLGNIIVAIALLAPPLVLRFAGYWSEGDDGESVRGRFVYDNVAAWTFWASFNLLVWWMLHFIVELAPKLFTVLVDLIWGDVSESVKTKVEVFHAAKKYVKPVIYAAMALGSWALLFKDIFNLRASEDPANNSRAGYTYRVYQVVVLLFFLVLVVCMEKLLLLAISMNFHHVAYADRIKKSVTALAILDKLKDYRPKRKAHRTAHVKGTHVFHSSDGQGAPTAAGIAVDNFQVGARPPKRRKWWQRSGGDKTYPHESDEVEGIARGNSSPQQQKQQRQTLNPSTFNGLQPPPTSLLNSSRASTFDSRMPGAGGGSVSDSASSFGKLLAKRGATAAQIARVAMRDPIAVVGRKSGLGLDINSPKQAKRLAKVIYFSFREDGKRCYLVPSDFYPAFATGEEAEEAFKLFDADGNGDISRTEIKNHIMKIYKERRALASTLKDVSHAIKKLDVVLLGVAAVVLLFIALSVFDVDYSSAFTSVYTIGIAAAFIFKETAAAVFDAVMLVFCTHPFDTGDRIFLDNNGTEEVLVVKRMGLLVTVFERWDGTEWFAPNSLLGSKFITNLRRSGPQFESATLQLGWDTTMAQIDALEEKMNEWLSTDEERRFAPSTAVSIQKYVNMQFMEVTVGMLHCENWQDWGARWARRTAFHVALNHYTRELGITFYKPSMPVHYNVTDLAKLPEYDSGDESKPSFGDLERIPLSPSGTVADDEGADEEDPVAPRAPVILGFATPPESGTGMRRRKKISRKKAMFGDA